MRPMCRRGSTGCRGSGFHWLVIVALGTAWILDGLEVTIVGSLSGALTESPVLHLSAQQVGLGCNAARLLWWARCWGHCSLAG